MSSNTKSSNTRSGSSKTINVSINGDACTLPGAATLAMAVAYQQDQQPSASTRVAAAVNGTFVPRSHYDQYPLINGDKVDIVKPIGGG